MSEKNPASGLTDEQMLAAMSFLKRVKPMLLSRRLTFGPGRIVKGIRQRIVTGTKYTYSDGKTKWIPVANVDRDMQELRKMQLASWRSRAK